MINSYTSKCCCCCPRLWSELCGPRCQFRGIFPHFLTACAQFEAGDTIGCLLCLPSLRSSLWFPSQMRNGNISRPETHRDNAQSRERQSQRQTQLVRIEGIGAAPKNFLRKLIKQIALCVSPLSPPLALSCFLFLSRASAMYSHICLHGQFVEFSKDM